MSHMTTETTTALEVPLRTKEDMPDQVLLSARQICKAFGPTRALVEVDLEVRRGEIWGLIGENGSGKSTLSSIIAGAQSADSGSFTLKGRPYAPRSMVDAQNHGVSMIVQEMGTIGSISVASNIFAGRLHECSRFGIVDFKEINRRAAEILQRIGAPEIRPDAMTFTLNFEDRKIVEMARAMLSNPDLLIIDETTNALAHRGREILYTLIRRMHDENKAVLFISHDLTELKDVCNAITVLRDGRVVGTLAHDQISEDRMRTMMVGRELAGSYFRSDIQPSYSDEVVLAARNVTFGPLENVSFDLHRGEILGIAGLSASGMHELGRVLFGLEKPLTGSVVLTQRNVTIDSPITAISNRMGYVSKERDREALILNANIRDNVVLPSLSRLGKTFGFVSKRSETELARQQIAALSIKCRDDQQFVSELSGGNKQKVVFSKWLAMNSDILILDAPTRGIDVGVKAAMYRLMEELKAQGKAIVMISEELPELIGMSDRILTMMHGKVHAEIQRGEAMTEENIIGSII
jgi:ribose transport system ATP-binding protein